MKKTLFWAGLLFIVIWGMVTLQFVKLEIKSLAALTDLWKMNHAAKKLFLEGPVYNILDKANDVIPFSPTQKVYVLGPSTGSHGANYIFFKSTYYLYPREVNNIDMNNFAPESMTEGSFFILIVPRKTPVDDVAKLRLYWVSMLNKLSHRKLVYQIQNPSIFAAILKVEENK